MEEQLVNEAVTVTNTQRIIELADSQYSNVRAAIAENRFTPRVIINKLAFDCVSNVSYVALNNIICTVKRNFNENDSKHRCVTCKKDRRDMIRDCSLCNL